MLNHLYCRAREQADHGNSRSAPERRRAVVRWMLRLLLLSLLFLALEVYTYSSITSTSPADVAVVLGAEVWDERPSPVFEERIKHAVNLYKAGTVRAIIFTGGVGAGDRRAESEVARQYAIERGVLAEHIYCETVSRTTYENLKYARSILDQQGLKTALIVSDPLHMRRAVTIARDLGIDANPSPTPTSRYRTWKSKLGFLVREAYYYASYLLRRPFLELWPRSVAETLLCGQATGGAQTAMWQELRGEKTAKGNPLQ